MTGTVADPRRVPLLNVEKPPEVSKARTGVTREDIQQTSAQGPGLGYAATTPSPITSPFGGNNRRKYDSQKLSHDRLWLQVVLSCSIMFADGFYATQIFPYVPNMTEELRGSAVNLGVYTGLLYTVQSAGMLLTASVWARMSNKYGRRICLLMGLSFASCTTATIAFSEDYWFTVGVRLLSGMLNNNLSIVRTALREAFQREKAEDTAAFSMLSVAFGASCVAGPSLGGIVYNSIPSGTFGVVQAWTPPMLLCTFFYISCLVLSFNWLPETADLKQIQASQELFSRSADGIASNRVSLLRQRSFLLLLVMAGGHSYCFTGWELVYPLFARSDPEHGGEGWGPQQVGLTFLVGSIGLMVWSLAVYPKLARWIPLPRLWILQCLVPTIAMPVFARMLPLALESGYGPLSFPVLLINYGAQLCMSVFMGSQFISVQLLINGYIAKIPNGASLLAMANGYLVSTQALVRATSPLTTGYLFTFGTHEQENGSEFFSESTAFDHLALTAFLCCIVAAVAYISSVGR